MAKKLDFRKQLRAIANEVQDQNATRLLASQAVDGGSIEPRKVEGPATTSRRRLRVFGARVSIKDLSRLGVRTGAMLADLTRRSTIRLGRTSFRIVPSPNVRARYWAWVKGREGQPARPTGGMTDGLLAAAADSIAKSGRDQVVAALQKRGRS